jgi:aminopeptidase-like protein
MSMQSAASLQAESPGSDMYRLVEALYPICRSITGEGVRETLRIIQQHVPIVIHEVASGTRVFDWTVPDEWNITDGYVKNAQGHRIIDFKKSNLHVMSYSVPIKARIKADELKEHLFTLPDHPDWVPYRTSYYSKNWGFCLSHRQLSEMQDKEYDVCIDSTLQPGALTYGEYAIGGETSDEILISCHVCHPSLANDNLSGIALAVSLAKSLAASPRRYSYRFLFIPGTIGSITWLALNEAVASRIRHGLVLASVGAGNKLTYKKSRRAAAEIDRAALNVLQHSGEAYDVLDFSPYGYDERQYCSPGFDLPVGCFMRTPNSSFPEYHTSADNLAFVRPELLERSFDACRAILDTLEHNRSYINQNPKCEPQLGKRGLYRAIGGAADHVDELAYLWVLNLSDGNHALLDIAERSGYPFAAIKSAADRLREHDLLKAA